MKIQMFPMDIFQRDQPVRSVLTWLKVILQKVGRPQ